MLKTIFEKLGGKYEVQGDYLIPCLSVSTEEEPPLGTWGQRHLDYLKRHHKVTYINLLTSGRMEQKIEVVRIGKCSWTFKEEWM